MTAVGPSVSALLAKREYLNVAFASAQQRLQPELVVAAETVAGPPSPPAGSLPCGDVEASHQRLSTP